MYDESSVMKYVMSAMDTVMDTATDSDSFGNMNGSERNIKSLSLISEEPIVCDDLSAVYSMMFHPRYPSLLLAAGKGGYVALFNVNGVLKSTGDDITTSSDSADDDDDNSHILFSFNKLISRIIKFRHHDGNLILADS